MLLFDGELGGKRVFVVGT
jgi:hypothetical protein